MILTEEKPLSLMGQERGLRERQELKITGESMNYFINSNRKNYIESKDNKILISNRHIINSTPMAQIKALMYKVHL